MDRHINGERILILIAIASIALMAFTTYIPVVMDATDTTVVSGRAMKDLYVGWNTTWVALGEVFCNESMTECVVVLDTSFGFMSKTDDQGSYTIPVPSDRIYVLVRFDGEYCLPYCAYIAPYDNGSILPTTKFLDMGEVILP